MPTRARAIVMREYGPPSVLSYAEVSLPPLKAGDVRIRSIASAVNHTDLEIRAGNWPIKVADPFPYIPGVDVVGEVDAMGKDVQDFHRGDRVITMMQGLGGVRRSAPEAMRNMWMLLLLQSRHCRRELIHTPWQHSDWSASPPTRAYAESGLLRTGGFL